jgi:ribosomal protein S18 acetylase RimI-like enzyme
MGEKISAVYDVDYSHAPSEIEELRQFLVRSYASVLKPFNWRLAMLENWIFASRYLEPVEHFTSRVHLWRKTSGELAAFVIRGTNFVHLQVDYQQRYLEEELLCWAEGHFANEQGKINLLVYDWDTQRQELLGSRGYQNLGAIEDLRIYDLVRPIPSPVLPPGYRFATMSEFSDFAERVELENRVWDVSLNEDWLRGKRTSPSYAPEGDLLVLSPEGRMAAFSLVWVYPDNCTAEIDPIGTHPDFRRKGLARALVQESFRRMRERGTRYAYIASETEDPIVSHLYTSFDPVEFYQGYHWSKTCR